MSRLLSKIIIFGSFGFNLLAVPHPGICQGEVVPRVQGFGLNLFTQPDTRAVVVAFLSFDCPVAKDYVVPLEKLASEYESKGIRFIGVVPGQNQQSVDKGSGAFKVHYPIIGDPDFLVARVLEASCTPEVFLLGKEQDLIYRGRIDDKYVARLKAKRKISREDLREALNEYLAGKELSVKKTEAVGCLLAGEKTEKQPKDAPQAVTFHKDVMPILQKHCQECHRPGESGPFSLTSYEDAAKWSEDIRDFTQSGRMPPWKPTGGMKFLNDRRMEKKEIRTLAKWVEGGCQPGNPKDGPPAKHFQSGWAMGEPDLTLTLNEDFHLGPNGADHYRCFVLPTGLVEDKHIVGFEVRPGNPEVVHHVLAFYDASGKAREMEKAAIKVKGDGFDQGPGYVSQMGIGFKPENPDLVGGFGGWAPGMRGVISHPGTGYVLPAGSDLIFQVHYHRNGKPSKDRIKIGLYFAKGDAVRKTKILKQLVVPGLVSPSEGYAPFTKIPAGKSGYKISRKVVVEENSCLYLIMPHMHMLGSKVKFTMTAPGGVKRLLLDVGEWDYAWQEIYHLAEPIEIAHGTIFEVEAEFDNSADNPLNPHVPPRDIPKGEGTNDEMLSTFLRLTSEGPGTAIKSKALSRPEDYRK